MFKSVRTHPSRRSLKINPPAFKRRWLSALGLILGCVLAAATAGAQPATEQVAPANRIPVEMQGIDIVEHLGDKLPLDLQFTNENGQLVTLGSYFNQDKPVLVNLVYYTCPQLCSMVINATVDGLKDLDFTPGPDFTVLTISIDPTETPQLAKAKKDAYVKMLGRPEAASGWHWHVGENDQIVPLADALGFKYRYDKRQEQYAHSAAIFFVSPDGMISRYMYGVDYDSKQMRLALLEASDGKIGSSIDRWIMRCYHYDPISRTYTMMATRLMRVAGVVTVFFLVAVIGLLLLNERRKKSNLAREVLDNDTDNRLSENTH